MKSKGREHIVALLAALVLLAFAIYFFMISISLMSYREPRVTASLLALIIGFVCLSSSLTLFKSTIYSRIVEKSEN